jgi:hypothetical protein
MVVQQLEQQEPRQVKELDLAQALEARHTALRTAQWVTTLHCHCTFVTQAWPGLALSAKCCSLQSAPGEMDSSLHTSSCLAQ